MASKKNSLTPSVKAFWKSLAKLNYLSHSCEADRKTARHRVASWKKSVNFPAIGGAFLVGFDPYVAKTASGGTVGYGGHLFKADDLVKASEEAAGISQSHYLSQAFESFEAFIKSVFGGLLWEWRGEVPPVMTKKKVKSLGLSNSLVAGTPQYYESMADKICGRNIDGAIAVLWEKLPNIPSQLRSTRHGTDLIDWIKGIEICRHRTVHKSGLGLSESPKFRQLTESQKTHARMYLATHFGRELIAPSRTAVEDSLVMLAEFGHVVYVEASQDSGMKIEM